MTIDHESVVEKKAKLQQAIRILRKLRTYELDKLTKDEIGEHNVINETLVKQAQGLGKFRNKMIHEYADIDIKKVYLYLQKAPDQFEQFDQAFSDYLSRG